MISVGRLQAERRRGRMARTRTFPCRHRQPHHHHGHGGDSKRLRRTDGMRDDLWQRIYLLEHLGGAQHEQSALCVRCADVDLGKYRMRLRRLLLGLSLTLACTPAFPATYTVNASQSTSTIQGVINGTSAGDTVSFSAGTYSITGQLTLKCGVTYTGPVASPQPRSSMGQVPE